MIGNRRGRMVGSRRAMLVVFLLCVGLVPALASRVTLKDGRVLEGATALLASMIEEGKQLDGGEGVRIRPILMIDDRLRRTFVPKRHVTETSEQTNLIDTPERFLVAQPVAENGAQFGSIGPFVQVTEFDDFGRRIVKMNTPGGIIAVIQGITEITPDTVRIQSLSAMGRPAYTWDMHMATTSVPTARLDAILARLIDPKNLDQRLKLVRFLLQSERYRDAEDTLQKILGDFPEQQALFAPTATRLRQAQARRILAELQVRRGAGQHALVRELLEKFPDKDVAGETLQAVREALDEQLALRAAVQELLTKFDAHLARLGDSARRSRLEGFRAELGRELNLNTLHRLDAYKLAWDDETLQPDELLAMAVSGWLVGSADTTRKLDVSLSLYETRDLVQSYLVESVKVRRGELLAKIRAQEGGSPALVAKLVGLMKPPAEPGQPVENVAGLYQFEVATLPGQPTIPCFVQLPPEYDPNRLYPTIVSMHGAYSTPLLQIDWWAGSVTSQGFRVGQATRHGYIVVSPAWAKVEQFEYGYTAEEHFAVLNSLRETCRRFSVDTDRVYLSGHSMGGDAAWDLALAHPDLWAGVIPVTAVADKYVGNIWENAAYVPFYLVAGERDGDRGVRNAKELDRYFSNLPKSTNFTVVEYIGRGHENYSDEIQRLFDWMPRYKRDFFPREFTCKTMRAWDNFFWWVELDELPSKTLVEPSEWPPRGRLPMITKAAIGATGTINVTTGAGRTTIWLAPSICDFSRPLVCSVNGRRLKGTVDAIAPDTAVILEDARTRGDRQHPFWAKLESP